jgi:hypothetical protein
MAPQMVWEIKRIGISIVSVKKREMKKNWGRLNYGSVIGSSIDCSGQCHWIANIYASRNLELPVC